MTTNERQFLDYFYTYYIVGRDSSEKIIIESYKLMYNESPDAGCNECLKRTFEKLKNLYMDLQRVEPPQLLKNKTEKNVIKTIPTDTKN